MPGQSPFSMMHRPVQPARQPSGERRRRWRAAAAAVAIVIVLAVAWSWLWYEAAAVTDRTLAGWMQREAAAGRVYSCDTQTIGGYPLGIQARCANIAAEIQNTLPPYTVTAKAVTFAAEAYRPTRLVGDISGPLTLAELGRPPSFAADWIRARISVRGIPPDPEAVSVELDGPHLDRIRAAAAGGGEVLFAAGHADVQGRLVAGSPRRQPVIEMVLHLAEATVPTLHPLFAAPVDVELDAELRGLKDLAPKRWADRLREMREAGGSIEIKSLRFAQAGAVVVGSGALSVDEDGKLDGLVRVAIVGIEHIVPLLGIDRLIEQGIDQLSGTDGAAAQGMGALDRLMPRLSGAIRQTVNAGVVENLKKMGEPTTINDQPAVVLPLRFSAGSIYLGMLRVGQAPRLF